MASYISSNDNRLYAAIEGTYGNVPAITAANYFSAVRMAAQQKVQQTERRDKTGTRSFVGLPARMRKQTTFDLQTYLTAWTNQNQSPPLEAFVQAALGGIPSKFQGGTVSQSSDGRTIQFVSAHGLSSGQAVTFGGEIRFVTAEIDARTIQLNAAFTLQPAPGSPIGVATTYRPANSLSAVSIFDYWGAEGAVHRIVSGAGVNEMRVKINGDFHELRFSGPARDLIDSATFGSGAGGMSTFPVEPATTSIDYSIVPGNLGQVWIGNNPTQFYTMTEGEVTVNNDIESRNREFGTELPSALVPGIRTVKMTFALYEQGNEETKELYQAARQRSPISVMLQLGEQPGQLMGIYLKGIVPEIPEYDDSERRLQWRFSESRAQGTMNDEIMVAFG